MKILCFQYGRLIEEHECVGVSVQGPRIVAITAGPAGTRRETLIATKWLAEGDEWLKPGSGLFFDKVEIE